MQDRFCQSLCLFLFPSWYVWDRTLYFGSDWMSAFPTLLLENKLAITRYMWKYPLWVWYSFLLHFREMYVNVPFLLMAWWAIRDRAMHSRCIGGRLVIPETQNKPQNWAVLLLYSTKKQPQIHTEEQYLQFSLKYLSDWILCP